VLGVKMTWPDAYECWDLWGVVGLSFLDGRGDGVGRRETSDSFRLGGDDLDARIKDGGRRYLTLAWSPGD
jgi:hypothetical protein